jgi:WD40 repeat protein
MNHVMQFAFMKYCALLFLLCLSPQSAIAIPNSTFLGERTESSIDATFNWDGSCLMELSDSPKLIVWNVENGERILVLSLSDLIKERVNGLASDVNREDLVYVSSGGAPSARVDAININSGKIEKTFKNVRPPLKVSPDGKYLGAVSAVTYEDKDVVLIDLESGDEVARIEPTKTAEKSRDHQSLCFSRDGSLFAVAWKADDSGPSAKGIMTDPVKLWSIADQKIVGTSKSWIPAPVSIEISQDGKLLMAITTDGYAISTIHFLNTSDMKIAQQTKLKYRIDGIFAPDLNDAFVALNEDKTRLEMWNISSVKMLHKIVPKTRSYWTPCWSPERQRVAIISTSRNDPIEICNLDLDRKPFVPTSRLQLHATNEYRRVSDLLQFSPDLESFAWNPDLSSGGGSTVASRVVDTALYELLPQGSGEVKDAVKIYSKRATAGGEGTWEASPPIPWPPRRDFNHSSSDPTRFVFLPRSNNVLALQSNKHWMMVLYASNRPTAAILYDNPTIVRDRDFEHEGLAKDLAISDDDKHLAVLEFNSKKASIHIFALDGTSLRKIKTVANVDVSGGDNQSSIAFMPDSKSILCGFNIIDLDSPSKVATSANDQAQGPITPRKVKATSDGRFVLGLDANGWLWRWDLESGELAKPFWIHEDLDEARIADFALTHDGKYVVIGANDGFARVWEISKGRLVAELASEGAVQLTFVSKDDKNLATVSQDGQVLFWDLADIIVKSE